MSRCAICHGTGVRRFLTRNYEEFAVPCEQCQPVLKSKKQETETDTLPGTIIKSNRQGSIRGGYWWQR